MNINQFLKIKSKDINTLNTKSNQQSKETLLKIEDLIDKLKLILNNNNKVLELGYDSIHKKVCYIVREKSGEKLYKKLEETLLSFITSKIRNFKTILNKEDYFRLLIEFFNDLYSKAKLIKKLLFYYETNFIAKTSNKENFILFTMRIFKKVLCNEFFFDRFIEYIEEQLEYERNKNIYNSITNNNSDSYDGFYKTSIISEAENYNSFGDDINFINVDQNSNDYDMLSLCNKSKINLNANMNKPFIQNIYLIKELLNMIIEIDTKLYYEYIDNQITLNTEQYYNLLYNSLLNCKINNTSKNQSGDIDMEIFNHRINYFFNKIKFIVDLEERLIQDFNFNLSRKNIIRVIYKTLLEKLFKSEENLVKEYFGILINVIKEDSDKMSDSRINNISNYNKLNSFDTSSKADGFVYKEIILVTEICNCCIINEDRIQYIEKFLKLLGKVVEKIIKSYIERITDEKNDINTRNCHITNNNISISNDINEENSRIQKPKATHLTHSHSTQEIEMSIKLIYFISRIEELKKQITYNFDSDYIISFNNIIKSSFSELNNKKDQLVTKLICKTIDSKFKSNNKVSYDELIDFSNQVLEVLKYIEDKLFFEHFHRKSLCTRILNSKTLLEEIEMNFISKLKLAYGSVFTYKMESMLKDIENSKNLKSMFINSKYSYSKYFSLSVSVNNNINNEASITSSNKSLLTISNTTKNNTNNISKQINTSNINNKFFMLVKETKLNNAFINSSQQEFQLRSYLNNINNSDEINELSHFPEKSQISSYLNINILTYQNWLLNSSENQSFDDFITKVSDISALLQLRLLVNFNKFYKTTFTGKVLSLNISQGSFEILMHYKDKRMMINCNSIQGIILLLLNNYVIAKNNKESKNNTNNNVSNTSSNYALLSNNNNELYSFLKEHLNEKSGEISIKLIKFIISSIKLNKKENKNNITPNSNTNTNSKNKKSSLLNLNYINSNNEFNISYINQQLEPISTSIVLPHLIPLIKIGLIVHNQDKDTITFNTNFKINNTKISLGVAKLKDDYNKDSKGNRKEQEQDSSEVINQRKNICESAIIRIMKAKKKINFNDLVNGVIDSVKEHFIPDILYLKTRIESLCERMFLKRDDNDVNCFYYSQ